LQIKLCSRRGSNSRPSHFFASTDL